jgi:cysteinyl-tRNA synthetase
MERFYATLKAMKDFLASCDTHTEITPDALPGKHKEVFDQLETLPAKFVEAMDDDFNTAKGIGHIFDAVRLLNGYLTEPLTASPVEACFVLKYAGKTMTDSGKVLGLFLEDPDAYFKQDNEREAHKRGINVAVIERLIEERRMARLDRDWKKADEIRQTLSEQGVTLKDTSAATTWKIV